VRSLEYELIASLAFHQFVKNGEPHFEGLLAISLYDRIPGLSGEYGLKRIHQLIKTIVQEFCHSVALPRSKKLTETRISFCSCDLMLTAEEDQLGLEDLIVFFELAKTGRWGPASEMLTHFTIMERLEKYRQERHEACLRIRDEQERKEVIFIERISPEPTAIKHLFDQATAKIVPFKKIS
jgi:hypothetical protein